MVEKKPNGEEEIRFVTEQKSIEWEVRKLQLHYKLYQNEEKMTDGEEILEKIARVKCVHGI